MEQSQINNLLDKGSQLSTDEKLTLFLALSNEANAISSSHGRNSSAAERHFKIEQVLLQHPLGLKQIMDIVGEVLNTNYRDLDQQKWQRLRGIETAIDYFPTTLDAKRIKSFLNQVLDYYFYDHQSTNLTQQHIRLQEQCVSLLRNLKTKT